MADTTEDVVREYGESMDRLIADFKAHKSRYLFPDDVVQHMRPDIDAFEEHTRRAIVEAIAHLGFTAAKMQAALKRKLAAQRAADKEAAKEAARSTADEHSRTRQATINSAFGGIPQNARDAVMMYVNHMDVTVQYDGTCFERGELKQAGAIEAAIMLTAEACGYTFGDFKIMSFQAIKLAWAEFLTLARNTRKDVAWQYLEETDRETAAKALAQLRALCDKLAVEPEFADAAIRKFIWQVKRRLAGMYVRDMHMLIFRGPQGCGKTELSRNLMKPARELACEADLPQMIDARNFLLRSMYVGFTDELARYDRADVNQLKGVITGETSTARVLYSHASQRNPVNLTLLGTADKPVALMVTDPAGMRRFVEVLIKPRYLVEDFDWQRDVVELEWTAIWQAVDHEADDPLMSQFADLLAEKQEAIRRRSTVEAWLEAFEFNPSKSNIPRKSYQPDQFVEFTASDLYRNSFRIYEDTYNPGATETSLTVWGINFKDLIDSGKMRQWQHRRTSSHVVYRLELSNVTEMGAGPRHHASAVVVPLPDVRSK